jgi:hypothetical protein
MRKTGLGAREWRAALGEVAAVQANVGDRVRVHGRAVGVSDRCGRIVEIRGAGGQPPYLVAFDDGHEGLIYPGPDTVIEPPDSTVSPP